MNVGGKVVCVRLHSVLGLLSFCSSVATPSVRDPSLFSTLDFQRQWNRYMVVLNLGFIIGPLLQPTINLSVEIILDFKNGKNTLNSRYYKILDVRDVALAHIIAFGDSFSQWQIHHRRSKYECKRYYREILRELFPDLCIADTNEESEMIYEVCGESEELGN
ncbi:Cinnamoyl-CoA reductase CAD2 [Cardamine amara subsp. amara]|uniref:Cinnamoyl-CoA reductase CAD2 n=1 Tax=Cardamine amara subsp. amara TaxID=228776 RepID=A0ABD1BTV8_CARAN